MAKDRCPSCGATRDYIKNGKCLLCGKKLESYKDSKRQDIPKKYGAVN